MEGFEMKRLSEIRKTSRQIQSTYSDEQAEIQDQPSLPLALI